MNTFFVKLFVVSVALAFMGSLPVGAASALRVQPTSYQGELARGEKKIGFIDVSNPTKDIVRVTTGVAAFKQISDDGSLQFYASEEVQAGIIPDLKEFELKPLEAMRLFFMLDGTKLPAGDVFGVLFVTGVPAGKTAAVSQPVRLGVLFSLVNGTPGPRSAEVTKLDAPFLQFGKSVSGSFTVRNKAPSEQATGFYPKVRVSVTPVVSDTVIDSPLVFAGRSRQSTFEVPTDRFGLFQLSVQTGSSEKSQWIFAMTGWGRFVPAVLFFLLAFVLIARRFYLLRK